MEKIREILPFEETRLKGRYITEKEIYPLLEYHRIHFPVREIGISEENRKIYQITAGRGEFKILIWSQMHGNESTTTKSLFDLLNFLKNEGPSQKKILDQCTITIIPQLNPDGALAYTRVNANEIDLNRDALLLSQKESRILRDTFENVRPDLCLNMHDQRTIYSVSGTGKPATVSFLSPSADSTKMITEARKTAMSLIAGMRTELERIIPGQIGRYDDTFNPNCVGDAFQVAGVPTILFEAGHFQEDYQREETRKFIFFALVTLLEMVLDKQINTENHKKYFLIPENESNFRDILIKNTKIPGNSSQVSIAIQFEEQLKNGKIHFVPKVDFIGVNHCLIGHNEINAEEQKTTSIDGSGLYEGQTISKLKIGVKNISLT